MPHINIKLFPGRSEEQKIKIVNEFSRIMSDTFGIENDSISIAFEEIDKNNWYEFVVKPEIMEKSYLLYKKNPRY